jgi:iron complex transport system substrate-binding protein
MYQKSNLFCLAIYSMVLLLHASCKTPDRNPSDRNLSSGTFRAASPDTAKGSHLLGKADIHYSHGFSIEYYDHYKLVSVLNYLAGTKDTLRYLLVPEGYPAPKGYPGAQVIHTPVRTIIGMSSMHIALAAFAGVAGRITGLGSLDYVSSREVRNNIKSGKVVAVGLEGTMNNELIITMHPGVLIATGNPDAGFGRYKTLTDAGVPVLLNNEWLETTPLGRAEWVKLMGALVDKEAWVDKKFDSIARLYNDLAQTGRRTRDKPHVIIGMPFKGTWYMPAGESYMAEFLRDAGAGYHWYDSKGVGSLALSFESAAPEALTAPFWLNVGDVDTKKEITDKDIRYGSFLAFRTGNLYNNNRQTNDQGSNDYWESGAVYPQVVLADMISILHPGLLPGHQLVYYKQLQ